MSFETWARKVPHFRGKFRLVKLLFRKKLRQARDITLVGKYDLSYQVPNLVENIGFELFADGEYEPGTVELVVKQVPANGSFIDIGANIGSIAIPVCKKRPDISAICIEASPRVFGYLRSNIELNELKNCLPVNRIVADEDDRAVDFFSPEELFGKGSVSPVFTQSPETAMTITLDSLLTQNNMPVPDFIKIDIEGYEYFVFKGGSHTLKGDPAPDILFEFLGWAEGLVPGIQAGHAQALLLEYGYRLYSVEQGNKLKPVNGYLKKGEAMLFATKKEIR